MSSRTRNVALGILCNIGLVMCATRTTHAPLRGQSAPPRTLRRAPQTPQTLTARSTAASRAATQAAPALAASRGPWRVYLAQPPRTDTTRSEGTEPDGTNYVVLGGMRAQIRGGNISWARDLILGGIIGSTRTQRGWLFASSDGALYRAPYFTAPVEFVASVSESALTRSYASRGHILAQDQQQRLWIGSDTAWSPLQNNTTNTNNGQGTFVTGSFLNDSVGVAIFSPGRAMATRNGGQQWTALDLNGQAAIEMIGITDSFVLKTLQQSYRFDATGQLTPFSGIAVSTENSLPTLDVLRNSSATEGPNARANALIRDGFALDRSQIYTSFIHRPVNERYGALNRQGSVAGDTLHVLSLQTPGEVRFEGPASDCKYLPFGSRMLAVCRSTGYQQPVAHLLNPQGNWTPIEFPSGYYAELSMGASTDGETLWGFNMHCDSRQRIGSTAIGSVSWCHSRAGNGWTAFSPERTAEFVASYGNYVVYRVRQSTFERGGAGPLRVQHIETGPESARAPARTDNRARLTTGQFTTDGTFFGRANIGDAPVLAVGPLDRPLAIRVLPPGTIDVGMVDRNRGLAVGKRLHELWSTDDAGETWQPIGHVIHGDPAGVMLDPEGPELNGRLQCHWWGCVVPDKLLWTAEALIGEPPINTFATPTPTTQLEVTRSANVPMTLDFGVQRCAPTAEIVPDQRIHLGHGGWLKTEPNDRFEWGGVDARGAFRTAIHAPIPAQDPPSVWRPYMTLMVPRWVSRNQAIVERCGYNNGRRYAGTDFHCDLLSFERQPARVRLWLSPRAQPGFAELNAPARIAEITPLSDGDFAVRIATGPLDEIAQSPHASAQRFEQQPRLDWVLRLHPDGTVVSQQSFLWARGETRLRMLASDGNSLGIAVVMGRNPTQRTVRFLTSPTDAGTDFGLVPQRPYPCTNPQTSNAHWVLSSANDGNMAIRAGREIDGTELFHGVDGVQAMLEFAPSGSCLRRVQAGQGTLSLQSFENAYNRLGGAITLEAVQGDFRTIFSSPIRNLSITCIANPAFR